VRQGRRDQVLVRRPKLERAWFNDGFHAAHHRAPAAHWTTLPAGAAPGDVVSALPPILRWAEALPAHANHVAATVIDGLERATLGIPAVRRLLLATHTRAWPCTLRSRCRSGSRTTSLAHSGDLRRCARARLADPSRARALPRPILMWWLLVQNVPRRLAPRARRCSRRSSSPARPARAVTWPIYDMCTRSRAWG
jgi:hypothetical protein